MCFTLRETASNFGQRFKRGYHRRWPHSKIPSESLQLRQNMSGSFGIKGFIGTSMVDWPGRISSVVFLGGCSFRCPACHNHQLALHANNLPDYPLAKILDYIRARKDWIDGITITGGEPTLRHDLPLLLARFKRAGLKIKLDTNGSEPSTLDRLIGTGLVDAVFMDVKAPLTDEEYSRIAGTRVNVSKIKRSIEILKGSGLEITFRTTVIPGLVEEPQLAAIKKFLGTIPRYIIQPFRNVDTLDPALRKVKEFSFQRLEEMKANFEYPPPASITEQYALTG